MARLSEMVSDNLLNCWKTLRGNQQRSFCKKKNVQRLERRARSGQVTAKW